MFATGILFSLKRFALPNRLARDKCGCEAPSPYGVSSNFCSSAKTQLITKRDATCPSKNPPCKSTCKPQVKPRSAFSQVKGAQPVEVFALVRQYRADKSEKKVNLSVGAYRTDDNKPYVLPIVRKVEQEIAADTSLNHEYLPILGNPDFCKAAAELVLGKSSPVVCTNSYLAVQTISGTGALRVAAEFLAKIMKFKTVLCSDPTWRNHINIFLAAGFETVIEHSYWDPKKKNINMPELLADLADAPPSSVIILHACAHNPTGTDPTKDEWRQICKVCQEKKIFVLFDTAYQGFATGDPDGDAWAVRYFIKQGMELMICQSFAKNFGLYNERIGNLVLVLNDRKFIPKCAASLTMLIRVNYSNPPAFGSRIIAKVLNDKESKKLWLNEIKEMSCRIVSMRKALTAKLKALKTPGKWDHITKQIGLFSYTGLTESQVNQLIKNKHIYLLKSGRINICGLTTKNIDYVAKSFSEVVKGKK